MPQTQLAPICEAVVQHWVPGLMVPITASSAAHLRTKWKEGANREFWNVPF